MLLFFVIVKQTPEFVNTIYFSREITQMLYRKRYGIPVNRREKNETSAQ